MHFLESVKKICLPILQDFQNLETPSNIIVAGYGLIDNGTTRSDTLIAAVLLPVNFSKCQEAYSQLSNTVLVEDLEFCAGGKGNKNIIVFVVCLIVL